MMGLPAQQPQSSEAQSDRCGPPPNIQPGKAWEAEGGSTVPSQLWLRAWTAWLRFLPPLLGCDPRKVPGLASVAQ